MNAAANMAGAQIGIVAIGRNEGERFKACLASLQQAASRIVYVDSGSRDDSVSFARQNGAHVTEIAAAPFTAARARNEGFAALMEKWPDTAHVFFIDGDCVLVSGFLEKAIAAFAADEGLGIVTGRCRERYPDRTVYNRLCEIEWNGPIGEIAACGGIFMARAETFRQAGGFNPDIIAAEDDDFCIRVRADGARIFRLDRDMCLHDADMHKFDQWRRRMTRAGYAFAQLGDMHSGYFKAERRRAWVWGLALPVLSLGAALFTKGLSLLLLLLYPASLLKTRSGLIRNGIAPRHASIAAVFLILSKFPTLKGMIDYRIKKARKRHIGIVEYK